MGRDEGGRVRRELYSTYDIDTVSSRQWSRVQIELNSTDGVAMVAPRLISGQNRLSLHIKYMDRTVLVFCARSNFRRTLPLEGIKSTCSKLINWNSCSPINSLL